MHKLVRRRNGESSAWESFDLREPAISALTKRVALTQEKRRFYFRSRWSGLGCRAFRRAPLQFIDAVLQSIHMDKSIAGIYVGMSSLSFFAGLQLPSSRAATITSSWGSASVTPWLSRFI